MTGYTGRTGDVVGPNSATDNAVVRFDGATGKLVQDSAVTVNDSGDVAVLGTVDGRDVAADGTKLDTVETSADVTDEANVTGALDGATLTDVGTPASGDLVLLQDASDANNLKVAQFGAFGGGGGGGGSGDVVGPASSTDEAIARFDGTTGKLLQSQSNTTMDDTGLISSYGTGGATTQVFGLGATAGSSGSSAFGSFASADGSSSTALGNSASADHTNAVAIGKGAEVTSAQGLAIGSFSTADSNALAFGTQASATGSNSVSIGRTSSASGSASSAIGKDSEATGARSLAVGNSASATATDATAVGNSTTASSSGAFALGTFASATQGSAMAIGKSATASNSFGLAIGAVATCDGSGGIAIGALSTVAAGHTNSIAIGRDSVTTALDQFVIGAPGRALSEMFLGSGVEAAAPEDFTINATGGVGSDVAGASLTLAGGRPTGAGAGGDLIFQTAPAGGSGSTQGTLAERVRILSTGQVGIGEDSPDYALDVNGTFGFTPGTSVTPVDNGDVVIEATNNTTLTFKLKGSDGTVRSATLTLT